MRVYLPVGIFAALIAISGSANAALVISKAPTSNVNCAAGVCTATAADAVLNVEDVKHLLKAGDLKIVSGSTAEDIAFNATLNWTKPSRLTLDAYRSITFTQPVTAEGTGAVTLLTNDGGTGGDYSFTDKGKIAFWDLSSSLVINGTSFTLVGDIATLASGIRHNPSGAFALARGYDGSVDGVYKSSPIATPFEGSLDGLGHSIGNLSMTIDKKKFAADLGLFRQIDASGVVRDLTIANPATKYLAKFSTNGVAALVGNNAGSLRRVIVVDGTVGGNACAGGLAGLNSGTIANAYVYGTGVSGEVTAGGLVCENSGSVASSGSSAAVAGTPCSDVGGFVGVNDGVIELSWSTGAVYGGGGCDHSLSNDYAGGFASFNFGTIDQSWSSSSVEGGDGQAGATKESDVLAGGFVTVNDGGMISRSYATGTAEAGIYGYLAGFASNNTNNGNINASYTIAPLQCDNCVVQASFSAGCPNGNFDYWDTDISPHDTRHRGPSCSGLTGLTDAQLKSGLPDGFDPAVWEQSASINNGYPYLLANPPPE